MNKICNEYKFNVKNFILPSFNEYKINCYSNDKTKTFIIIFIRSVIYFIMTYILYSYNILGFDNYIKYIMLIIFIFILFLHILSIVHSFMKKTAHKKQILEANLKTSYFEEDKFTPKKYHNNNEKKTCPIGYKLIK